MGKRMLIMLVVTGVVFGGLFGYHAIGNYMMNKYFSSRQVPPVTVATGKVRVDHWQPDIRAVGDIRAARGVDIAAEVSGIVAEVRFTSGMEVKEGDVLLKMNTDADQAQLDALNAAAGLAETVYERDRKQLEAQAISQAVVDNDAAELKSRRAQVAQQEAMVAKKIIRAPFSGKVGISAVNAGQYLNPGEKIVPLQALDPARVDFFLPQQELSRVSAGQEVIVTVDAYPGRAFPGVIAAVNAQVEKNSRNILLEATVVNPDKLLLPGMYATVNVQAGAAVRYLTIPQAAVAFNPYGETVYVVESGENDAEGKPVLKARQTFITTGETRGDMVAVLTGLKEADVIVTAGQHKLRNGSVILVNDQVQPGTDVAPHPVDQ